MQVQFGNAKFTKTKFDGLDGKTVVAFASEDSKIEGRATSQKMTFRLEVEAYENQEVAEMIHAYGQLVDAVWKEHARLKKGADANAKLVLHK